MKRKHAVYVLRVLICSFSPQMSEIRCVDICISHLLALSMSCNLLWLPSKRPHFVTKPLRLLQSNQSFLLWLLLRGTWPFHMWPFFDFSLRSGSSPSASSDSVSSLSLRSSWTMSCGGKFKTCQNVRWSSGGLKVKVAIHTLPGRNLMTMRKMSPAQKICRACSTNISPLKK